MSLDITLYLSLDRSQADNLLDKLLTKMPSLSEKILGRATAVVEQELRNAAPERTGALKSSIMSHVGSNYAEVTVGVPYAVFVDQGSAPHIIQGEPLLVFEKDGRSVFARKVNHPGNAGAHFSEKAILAAGPLISALVNAEVTALLEA